MRITPFRLERYFARHEFSAPYSLRSSDCESMELRDLLALEPGAREQFDSLWLGYTESLGHPRTAAGRRGAVRARPPPTRSSCTQEPKRRSSTS